METNFAVSKPATREMRNLLFAVWPLQLQKCIKPSILLPYMVQRDLKKWWTYGLTKNWVIFYIFASFVLDIEMPLQIRHQEPTRYKGQLISECPEGYKLLKSFSLICLHIKMEYKLQYKCVKFTNRQWNDVRPALLWWFSHYKNTKNKGGLLPLHLATTQNS